MSEQEAFSEELCLFRKYAFEFGQSNDMEAYELMIKCQVNLHALYEVSDRYYNFMKDFAIGTEKLNLELKADNEQLREALENIVNTFYEETDVAWMRQCYDLMESGNQTLSATPAESLQSHDNEVIERCAKEVENLRDGMCIAEIIRALKGK